MIYCGDCLEVMGGLADNSVSSVITDPPYGVDYEGWDSDIPPQRFLDECLRVSAGPVVMFGAAPKILEFARYRPGPDRILIWAPAFTLSHTMGNGIAYRYHPIYVWGMKRPDNKAIPWDVLRDNTECGNWWKHRATKPVSLMMRLVGAFGGDIVLDPYMGSGTTGVACMRLGKEFIGVDNDPGCIEIAERRLKDEMVRPLLF